MDILLPLLVLKGLELTLAASVVALIVLLLRRFGRHLLGPQAVCWLWLLFLLKLAVPFPIPSPLSIDNWIDSYLYERPHGVGGIITAAGRGWNEVHDLVWGEPPSSSSSLGMSMYRDGKETWISLPPPEHHLLESVRVNTGMTEVLIALACLWLTGSIIYAAIEWKRRWHTRRLVQSALPCEDRKLLDLFEACKKESGSRGSVRLLRSGILFPALTGLTRPAILLPYDYDRKYSAEQLRFILLHELMHYKHKDIFFFVISRVLQIVHWMNPIVHWAMKKVRDDLEIRCDSSVLGLLNREEGIRYGMLLIRQGEMNGRTPFPASFGANWLGGSSQLAERIRQIAHRRKERRSKSKTVAGIGMFALLCLCLLPSNHLYATVHYDNTPTLYVFWLDERVNLRSMQTISSMAGQMSGVSPESPQVALLMKSDFIHPPLQQAWTRLRLLAEGEEEFPVTIETQPIRDRIRKQGLREGKVLVMVQYPYSYAKYWGFSISKKQLTDLTSLELLEQMKLY